MTSNDKPRRPGGKPPARDKKSGPGDKKSFAGAKKPIFGDKKRVATEDVLPPKPVRAPRGTIVDDAAVPQRISKILARVGIASRRDIERMIMEGRVSLNGKVLDTPVVNATLSDTIEVDGQPIRGIERTRLWLYHKPTGLVTTNSDPEGRPTVFDSLPEELPRVLSIGRLDINTEGLLLLTNDGGLARVLELPATGWLRRYRVRAHGTIEQAELDKLRDGVAVDGVLYGSIDATLDKVQGANVWITMGLREGKNREIKNVMGALGLDVNRLIRISYGPFQLGELPEGHVQEIKGRTLRDQLGPRLIEDAKANFDAPIYDAIPEAEEKPERGDWAGKSDKPERGAFREKPEDKRERALSRLDTKRDERPARPDRDARPDRAARPERKDSSRPDRNDGARPARGRDAAPSSFDDRPKREPAQRARKANVWMAPGARPVAEKKPKVAASAEPAEKPLRRERPDGAPKAKRYGRTADGTPVKSKRKFNPDRQDGPRPPFQRPDSGPRVIVQRADDDADWIRASDAPAKDDGRGGRDGKRGDRPARDGAERPFADRKPRRDEGERPFAERKPRADGERPRSKSFDGKPAGERPAGARPFGAKPGSGGPKPRGDRPGGKPSGGRPAGGSRPAGKPRGRGNV